MPHQIAARLQRGKARVDSAAIAGEKAVIEQADVQFDVPDVELRALIGRVDGLADAQSGVPEFAEIGRERFAQTIARGSSTARNSRSISE